MKSPEYSKTLEKLDWDVNNELDLILALFGSPPTHRAKGKCTCCPLLSKTSLQLEVDVPT